MPKVRPKPRRVDRWYFAYGSNLCIDQKQKRTGVIRRAGSNHVRGKGDRIQPPPRMLWPVGTRGHRIQPPSRMPWPVDTKGDRIQPPL